MIDRRLAIGPTAVALSALAVARWGVIVAAVVMTMLATLVGAALWARPSPPTGRGHDTWLAFTLAAFAPVVFGVVILAITPTYFRPLYSSTVGVWMLGALAVAVAGTHGLVHVGVKLITRNHKVLGATMIAIALPFVALVVVLILLGPAIAILSSSSRI